MMAEESSGDLPIDDLSIKLQDAMAQGQIVPDSPGYAVARSLIVGKWKDLDEDDRAVFNKHVRPIVERREG